MERKRLIVGIDASRCRSGGAQAHLVGILSEIDPKEHGIEQIHLWTFRALAEKIPNAQWLIKHEIRLIRMSLVEELFWQAVSLKRALRRAECDVLFTADASTVNAFTPQVVLSQDLLSYEDGIMQLFGWGPRRLRLIAIRFLQNRAFRRASGVMFLSSYSSEVIQRSCGVLSRTAIVPHGVATEFFEVRPDYNWRQAGNKPIECVYVSNAEMYKHQWVVIKAIEMLKRRGYNVRLQLIGGGSGAAQAKTMAQMLLSDPEGKYIRQHEFISHHELPGHLAKAHIFIFASSCETFGITLLEGMAAGLPIACSNRSSLSEILGQAGVYFDPEDSESIREAVELLIEDRDLRQKLGAQARSLAMEYSWRKCAAQTFDFIAETIGRKA